MNEIEEIEKLEKEIKELEYERDLYSVSKKVIEGFIKTKRKKLRRLNDTQRSKESP